MKRKHFIDIHKGATAPIVLFLMYFYNRWENQTAWTYLALHGTYGILWTLKSRIFPDKKWEKTLDINFNCISSKTLLQKGYKKIQLPRFKEKNISEISKIKKIIQSYYRQKVVFFFDLEIFKKS